MSVEFMREKEKMLTLVGQKRDKQSKSRGTSKNMSSSKEEDKVQVTKKRLHEEGTADDSGPDLKSMKVAEETAEVSSGEELACPEEPSSETQAAAVEQKIETRILEDVECIAGVKE